MATRAAAFTAKVRNLQDYHLRLTNGVMPLPTGLDISNTLKYFTQTMLGVLKDVPQFPLEMLKQRSQDPGRMQLFPNLDYKSLFTVIVQLIEDVPAIQFGIQMFGQCVLQTLAALLPFLEHEQIDTLPYTVASSLGTLPASLHKEIIDMLCYYLFPITISKLEESPDKAAYASNSVSAVLMMVFQYTSGSEHHCQTLEAVMRYKRDAIKDLLCVVAYGTLEARNVAINLLVYYWPHHNPTLYDRRNIKFKFSGYKVPSCKSEMCSVHNTGASADATKLCYDHSVGISLSPENPPPLFLCQECASRLQSEQPNAIEHLVDVGLPISRTGTTCDNKNCRSQGPEKIMNGVICFNSECASYNGNRPMRYCQQCHSIRHNNRRGADHVFHLAVQPPNYSDEDVEVLNFHVEAIVSLLLEAEPLSTRGSAKEDQQTRLRLFTDGEFTDPIPIEERRLMGRYGIWLLVGFFSAEEETPKDILCRLLSSLFQWFNTTAYSGDDPSATALERLKTDIVCPWLKKIIKNNFETFVSCLLPHPPDFARVGGHWDVISSRTYHLREGFNRLFCLIPYEVISPEIWSQMMPNWMESMASEVPEEEMGELKVILSKVMELNMDMNPLGFDARQMYHFIAVRFHQTSHKVKEQALKWLQVLSKLEIVIPLYFIFSIFREGIRPKHERTPKRGSVSTQPDHATSDMIAAICQEDSPNASSLSDEEDNFTLHAEKQSESELMLSSFIFMLDIILKQLELQEVEQHKGLQSLVAKDAMTLLHNMVAMPWPGSHSCQEGSDCQFCEMAVLWYQLALEIVEKLAPATTAIPPDAILSPDGEFGNKYFPEAIQKLEIKPELKPSISPKSESMGLEGIIVNMPQILTATVETVSDLDLAPIMPSEKVVKAVARAVTITESETASATAHVTSAANLVGEEQVVPDLGGESDKDFWTTSVGKFKFSIEELPPYLQFTFELLKKIPDVEDPELMEYLLKSLKIMFLHEEVLLKAAKEHRGFVIWCQENLLIKNLWELMDAEYSQLCEHAVPILVHCITLPVGADTFWKQIEQDFQSPDWRRRFTAVERVVTISRFIDSYPVRSNQSLQTALANAFCYTISSLDDPHVAVAQRASLYLGTINDSAVQSFMYCLGSQFDSVIIDRPVIMQSLYLLINSVSDRKILRWDFFLNCFDTLFIEAQITLERLGEVSFSKDVRQIDSSFEHFIKKFGRIQDALSMKADGTPLHKTLYSSLGTKWPYKRTMSAPAGFTKSDKHYSRQSSAPVLKRKGSRHGIDGHIHGLLGGDDSNLSGVFHRIVEIEESDKETIHLLVFLFMQFLSRYCRGTIPSDNRNLGRTQTAVLRHFTMLLGYAPQDKSFFLTPNRVRVSPIFNSFISNLPQTLDQNFKVGATILPISLTVLHYCPSPTKSAGSRMHPSYSLWFLEPHVRRHWLISLIVILYKFDYGLLPLSSQVQTVIKIVLNTLNYQEHRCRPLPATLILDEPTRSREVSRATIATAGDLEHITERETPPVTPTAQNVSPSFTSRKEHRKSLGSIPSSKAAVIATKKPTTPTPVHSAPESSFDFICSSTQEEVEEMEPELAAIPESPKSHDSGELFGELMEMNKAIEVGQSSVHQEQAFQTVDQLQQVTVLSRDSPRLETGSGPLSASSDKSKTWFAGGEVDSKSSSSAASTTSGQTPAAAKTEFPWHLSVQAAFQIAKIPAPPLERLLPVGTFNPPPLSPTVKTTSRTGDYGSPYESSEAMRMDMISLGPQVLVDESAMERLEEPRPHRHSLARSDAKNLKEEEYAKALQYRRNSLGRSMSPKKLIKQTPAFETGGLFDTSGTTFRTGEMASKPDALKTVGFLRHSDISQGRIGPNVRQSSLRIGDESVQDRCLECGVVLETYTNEELGLCLVALETFIHREPSLAAPMLQDILRIVTRIALKPLFSWQAESTLSCPGGVSSVAFQFLRCVLHQLAPYGVFVQLFQTKFSDRVKSDLFKSISIALTDFAELNPVAPLQLLLEALNARKSLVMDTVTPIIDNVAVYLEYLPLEAASITWSSVIPLFEAFFRKILPIIQPSSAVEGILRTMACLLRMPGISAFKSILDPFSKILSFALSNIGLRYHMITDLCYLCHRAFLREREKQFLTRVTVIELVSAMKFKSNIPDANFLMLVTFILQDAGGSLAPYMYVEGFPKIHAGGEPSQISTGAAECMRQHLTDSIEFLADFHSLSKIKSNYKGVGCGLNDDTLGGVIKGGVSQFIALEISRGNNRENRAIGRHLPWLYNAPSAIQQGPKEFLDCVAHIRVLSWLLLGSLTHTAMYGQNTTVTCVPIPLEASCHVADHVHVIMTGFSEQSKASVLHMSSLFHAFILCQVWTIYLEQVGPTAQMSNSSDPANVASNILTDFWGKVTPAILQLISHSKVLAEMVNLHFLSLLESLLECNSSVFNRLLPLWSPVLYAHTGQLSSHTQVRLQACLGYPPPLSTTKKESTDQHGRPAPIEFPSPNCGPVHNMLLLKWVQRLQFKMAQIELQSSAATQFYPI